MVGAQDRSLLKPRGTHSPSTKCLHGGTGNPAHYPRTDCPGGGNSVVGLDVRGGQYILGRNVRGTAFPKTECPADNLQRGQNFLRHQLYAL